MGGGVVAGDHPVPALADHLIFPDHEGGEGPALGPGEFFLGKPDGLLHEWLVHDASTVAETSGGW